MKICLRRVVRANECYSLCKVRRCNRDIFSIFFNMKVCCLLSLKSPHRGNTNEYTQYTIFNITLKISLNYPVSAVVGFSLGTQEQVQNSRGKRAISVPATQVLLYQHKVIIFIVSQDGFFPFLIHLISWSKIFWMVLERKNPSNSKITHNWLDIWGNSRGENLIL